MALTRRAETKRKDSTTNKKGATSRALFLLSVPGLFSAGLADIDLTIEVGELQFGPAPIDAAANGLIDLHLVFSAVVSAVFDDGLR